jgi:hypothetical protein
MVVPGLQKAVEFHAGEPHVMNVEPTPQPTPEDLELGKNFEAILPMADALDLNRHRLLDT